MIEIETCPKCNGTGLVQIAPNVRGLKRCPFCNGYGTGKIKTKREESNENNEDDIIPAQEEKGE